MRFFGGQRLDRWVTMNAYEVQHNVTREIAARCWANFDCGELCATNCSGAHQCTSRVGEENAGKVGLCEQHYELMRRPIDGVFT